MATKTKKKKQNFIVRYFSDFGMIQFLGIVFVIAAILIGFALGFKNEGLLLGGLYTYAITALLGVVYTIVVFKKVDKKRSPAYRNGLINMIIMLVVFAIAVALIVYVHIKGIYVEKPL